MSQLRLLRPEDYKCWICLEAEPSSGEPPEWRRVCPCNLVAHESCLLRWVDELVATNSSKPPVCPQCKREIFIIQHKSSFLQLRDVIESANSTSIKLFIGAAIGGSALTALYTTLYTLGATSIRFMCSPDMALDILGIVVKSTGIEIHPVSLRKALLIPIIPVALVASRSSSTIIDILLCLIPFALADKSLPPWKFTGSRLTVSVLPVLRLVYFRLYKLLAQPLIDASARNMRSRGGITAPNPLGIQVEFAGEIEVQDDRNENNEGGNAQEAPERENDRLHNILHIVIGWIADRFIEHNPPQQAFDGDDEDDEVLPPDNPNQPRNAADEGDNEQQMENPPMANGHAPRIRRAPAQPQEDYNWVISRRRLSLTIGNALLLPFFSNFVGLGLSQIPFIRRLVPDYLQRNVLGGILVIGVKDIVNVATSYLRMKKEKSMRVLQIQELYAIERLANARSQLSR